MSSTQPPSPPPAFHIPKKTSILQHLKVTNETSAQRESYLRVWVDPTITDARTVVVLRETITALREEISQLCTQNEDTFTRGELRKENYWKDNDDASKLLMPIVHPTKEEELLEGIGGQALRALLLQTIKGWDSVCELNRNTAYKEGRELKDVEVGESH